MINIISIVSSALPESMEDAANEIGRNITREYNIIVCAGCVLIWYECVRVRLSLRRYLRENDGVLFSLFYRYIFFPFWRECGHSGLMNSGGFSVVVHVTGAGVMLGRA